MGQQQESLFPPYLAVLLVADFVFIGIYAVCSFWALPDGNMFSLGWDGGYPEIYQYCKLGCCALLLIRTFFVTQQFGFLVWALFFSYLLLDDSLRIHERATPVITVLLFGTAASSDPLQHVVEFGFCAVLGLLLVGLLIPFYRSGFHEFKTVTHGLLFLLTALAFFGVAVDLMNSLLNGGWLLKGALGAIEESGEMFVLSLTLGYLLFLRLASVDNRIRVTSFIQSTTALWPIVGRRTVAPSVQLEPRAIVPPD